MDKRDIQTYGRHSVQRPVRILKKYAEVFKITFKAQIVYRFDVVFKMLFTVSKLLFAYVLWGAIFGERDLVGGLTFQSTISYYMFSSFMNGSNLSASVGEEIGDRIRMGSFSKYMVIPVDIQGYFTVQTFGASAFYLIFQGIAAFFWILIPGMNLVMTKEPQMILYAGMLYVLGMCFLIQLYFFIGLLALKFVEIWMFRMLLGNIMAFISGSLIPLYLLPEGVLAVMRLLPFYYTSYLPAMLLIGENKGEALVGIMVLTSWTLCFTCLNRFAYQKMRVLFDGVGI